MPITFFRAMVSKDIFPWILFPAVVGTWFGFANPVYHAPLLVFLFPMILSYAGLTATSHRQAWQQGWIAGAAVYACTLYWVVIPVHQYGHIPLILALPCPLLIGTILGGYTSAYTLCIFHLRTRLSWPLLGFFAGTLWATIELVQSFFLTGFPWLVLPSALSGWPAAIAPVGTIGAFGLAGCMTMVALWTVQAARNPQTLIGIIAVIGLCTLPTLFPGQPSHRGKPIRTLIVQGNIDQDHKWDPAFQQLTLDTYDRLSREYARDNATDLVIWPETAMPFYFQEATPFRARITSLVQKKNLLLITGAPGYTLTPGSSSPGYKLYNRAFCVLPSGECTSWYDKRHLVPFGEYVPFSSFIPFIKKLVAGAVDFSPGHTNAPLTYNQLSLGTLICYEAIFPGLAQDDVKNGANILVNISNDTWFGRSSAPLQHLNLSILRAVEQNRFLIRCTNTGISAFIDNQGHILNTSKLFEEQVVRMDAVYPIVETSFYHKKYFFIHGSFPLLTLLIGLYGWRKKNKQIF